jgi:hypothetical protein
MQNTIWHSVNGKMIKIGKPRLPNNFNFLITCQYGDWSGFGALAECESRIPELEKMMAETGKGENYCIVER